MTEENAQKPSPMQRFWGALLMGVGGLIAALGGLCTIGVDAQNIISAFKYPDTESGWGIVIPLSLLVGLIPVGIGVGLFNLGRDLRLSRRDGRPNL